MVYGLRAVGAVRTEHVCVKAKEEGRITQSHTRSQRVGVCVCVGGNRLHLWRTLSFVVGSWGGGEAGFRMPPPNEWQGNTRSGALVLFTDGCGVAGVWALRAPPRGRPS